MSNTFAGQVGQCPARCRRLAVLVLFSASSVWVNAQPTLVAPQSNVSAQASAGNVSFVDKCGNTVVGSSFAAFACQAGSAPNSAIISGAAGYGAVHASVTARGGTSGDAFGSSGNVNAYFSDSFALRGPANTAGVINGRFVIGGTIDAIVSGAAQAPTAALAKYSVQASLAGSNFGSDGSVLNSSNGFGFASNVSGQILPVAAPVSFGPDGWAVLSVSVLAQINAEGSARSFTECSVCATIPGEYVASASFGNTIYWGGISSITVGGTPLASYDYLASASGVDYRLSTEFASAPVPEPGPAALLGVGLAVLAAVRRRSRD